MNKKDPEVKVYDYHPSSTGDNFNHLPFPQEGDSIWVGDDLGKIVSREIDVSSDHSEKDDDQYTRYMEIKIRIKI